MVAARARSRSRVRAAVLLSTQGARAHGRAAAAYADPKHVGVVVRFFYDDYITFQLALPEYARRALLHLQHTASPYALEAGRLGKLMAIEGSAVGVD